MYTIIDKNGEKSSIFSGIVGGTLSLTVSAIIVKIIGLIYKIPISSLLGDEGMGYFNSAYTVYAFFYLLCTAGVPKAVMILVSEAKARGENDVEERIVSVASRLFLLIGGGVSILFLIFSAPIATLIGNSRAFATMLAVAPSIILVSLSGVLRGFLSANARLGDIAVSQVIEGAGKLVLGLIFAMVGVRLKLSLEILSALTILGVTFGALFGLMYLLACLKSAKKKEKAEQKRIFLNNKTIIKRILSISIPITFSAAIMSITNIIDLGLIMRSLIKVGFSEESASALYGNYTTLAVPMFNLALSVISPISVAFLPVFTRCFVAKKFDDLKKAEKTAIEITALICAPMMIGLMTYSKEILAMLFKNSEINTGAMLLCLICPAILFSSLLLIVNTLLEAYGKVRAPLISMGIGSIAKIGVSYYLITRTDMGISGAPIGTVVSYGTALLVSIIIYGSSFKKRISLFEGCILPHFNAFISVMLSRIIFERLNLMVPETPALVLSILLAALIYLMISGITGVLKPKKIGEMAKYTKLTD